MSDYMNSGVVERLLVPTLGGLPAPQPTLSDRADLIVKVYTDMGIFKPEAAEEALEVLRANPLTSKVGSFVVVNLTPEFNLETLAAGFGKGINTPFRIDWQPWLSVCLMDNINRRTVPGQGGIEPVPLQVRVHHPTDPENELEEFGLVGMGKSINEQRRLIGSDVVLNITDYAILQRLNIEEGKDPLDGVTTHTVFPQMDEMKFLMNDLSTHKCFGQADGMHNQFHASSTEPSLRHFGKEQIGFRLSHDK